MIMVAESRNAPVDELITVGVKALANVQNIFPSHFQRVRDNLVLSAGFFDDSRAKGLVKKLPHNYFSALWKYRMMP